jgi:hypothetical protein
MTVTAEEFLRRFLLHTLPRGFVRIRFCGFLANRRRGDLLPLCQELLRVEPPLLSATTIGADSPPACFGYAHTAEARWFLLKSSLLNRSVGDLLGGRACVTRRRTHPSTKHWLAAARTADVCLDIINSQKQPENTASSSVPQSLSRCPSPDRSFLMLQAQSQTASLKPSRRLNTHRLPRPPQTRAAPFKRLYLK